MTKEVAQTNQNTAVATQDVHGIGIPGLEYMPTSFIPVPRIRLVQPNTSSDVTLADGNDARKGTFYYENLQESQDELRIALIAAKPMTFTGPSLDDPTVIKTSRTIGLLFLDMAYNKVMTMRFTPGSFGSWRSLMGRMVAAHEAGDMATAFAREVIVKPELIKEGARAYYVLRFEIGRKLDDLEFETAAALYQQYSTYFNREEDNTEEDAA